MSAYGEEVATDFISLAKLVLAKLPQEKIKSNLIKLGFCDLLHHTATKSPTWVFLCFRLKLVSESENGFLQNSKSKGK